MSDVSPPMPQNKRTGSALIRPFTDLILRRKARAIALESFRLSKSRPAEGRYALTEQARRSARSVGANIAEGWGWRRHEAAFVAKGVDADGEAHETERRLVNAEPHGCDSGPQLADLRSQLAEGGGRMLGSMINRPPAIHSRRLASEI